MHPAVERALWHDLRIADSRMKLGTKDRAVEDARALLEALRILEPGPVMDCPYPHPSPNSEKRQRRSDRSD